MTTTERRSQPKKAARSVTRMDCPGVEPGVVRAADTGIGGRDTGWSRWHPDGEDDSEPGIVRGRE
jgi:hypothetical protein